MKKTAKQKKIIKQLKGGLILSCQGETGTPFYGYMHLMAKAGAEYGSVGIRANGKKDTASIRKAVDLPIIGINKKRIKGYDVFITPDFAAAKQIIDVGAEIVALEATHRSRKQPLEDVVAKIRDYSPDTLLMADISNLAEGVAAAEMGFDFVGTTLAGYTPYSRKTKGPDFTLIRQLKKKIKTPIIGEGRIWTPDQARKALDCGAYAVVVGTVITRPHLVVEAYVKAMKKK